MRRVLAWLALSSALIPTVEPVSAQGGTADPPRFVDVWLGGPLDSIYNAEYARLSERCAGLDASCWVEGLDGSSVRLGPVWATPEATRPTGWLVTRLRTSGRYPHAALLFEGTDGVEVELMEDLGDWGYGTTLALRDARDGRVSPWLLAPAGNGWLSVDGGVGYGVVDGPYGLEGRLWSLGPVRADRLSGGAPTGVEEELTAEVYMVLGVEEGVVRLRPEVPADMDCGDVPDGAPSASSVPVYAVPLERLRDADGRPRVAVAYGRGC